MAHEPKQVRFSEPLADTICERIARGESLNSILREPGMPSYQAVCLWLRKNEQFAAAYRQARIDQADTLADQILEIADQAKAEDAQVARLRVDARKWVAAKLKPQVYGDKLLHTGSDGYGPIEYKMTHDWSRLSPDELELLERLIEKAAVPRDEHKSSETGAGPAQEEV